MIPSHNERNAVVSSYVEATGMPYSIKFNRYFHLATSRPRSTLLSAAWGFHRDFKMPNVQPVPASAAMVSNCI